MVNSIIALVLLIMNRRFTRRKEIMETQTMVEIASENLTLEIANASRKQRPSPNPSPPDKSGASYLLSVRPRLNTFNASH
jgi:hypothetical protein